MLNLQEQEVLLNLARKTIQCSLSGESLPPLTTDNPNLKVVQGVFVTLKKHGDLRGCIGNIIGVYPLNEGVQQMAIAAAFSDSRFPPLAKSEFADLELEISVLTPPQPIQDISEIEIGRHGIILKKGFNQGVFLPQVPVEQGWNLNEYLEGISHKSGLSSNGWHGAELFVFEAQVFD